MWYVKFNMPYTVGAFTARKQFEGIVETFAAVKVGDTITYSINGNDIPDIDVEMACEVNATKATLFMSDIYTPEVQMQQSIVTEVDISDFEEFADGKRAVIVAAIKEMRSIKRVVSGNSVLSRFDQTYEFTHANIRAARRANDKRTVCRVWQEFSGLCMSLMCEVYDSPTKGQHMRKLLG